MPTKIESNIARITAAIQGNTVSDKARKYLEELLTNATNPGGKIFDAESIEKVARLTSNSEIGIAVYSDGESAEVHYGGYRGGYEFMDCAWCDMSTILDVMEDDDAVPSWFDDDSVYVEVLNTSNAYGYEIKSRGELDN